MPKAPAALTSPKIKKLAAKAQKSPSMLTTVETRELGAAVSAYLAPKDSESVTPKNIATEGTAAKKSPAKKSL